ncbi:MAG: hypothetical protein L0H78_24250 [Humibacillus sp.]|nr:hypothetical protein [Humibacillus sp.]
MEAGDRVKARAGTTSAIVTGSALGWVHDFDPLGAWVLWDSGHIALELEVDLETYPFTAQERSDFRQAQRLVWELCDYFLSGWWTQMPMVNPHGRPLCDHPHLCQAHRDPIADGSTGMG